METRTFLAVAFCVAGTLGFARSASAHDVEKSTWDGTYLFSISVGPVDSSTPAGNLVTAGLHVTQAIDVTRFDETKKGINVSFNVASSNGDAGSCTGEVVGVDFRGWHVTSTCAITSIDGTCTQNLTRDDYFGEDFFGARIERTSLSTWTAAFALADESASLVAVTATLPLGGRTCGAVYSAVVPLPVMVPTAAFPPATPFTLQLTEASSPPVTRAVNCTLSPRNTPACVGLISIEISGGTGSPLPAPAPPPHPAISAISSAANAPAAAG